MLYSLVKPLLFSLDPELAHDVSMDMLQLFHRLLPNRRIDKPVRVMGLDFPNPVGLAAGLDKIIASAQKDEDGMINCLKLLAQEVRRR